MIEPINKYAKIGLIHFMAYPSTIKGEGPIEETIRKIAVDDYFDAIEVTWIKDPETRKRAKKMLDSSKLTVAYGGQPRLLTTGQNINDLDESKRQIALANLKEGIDEAYKIGAVGFGFLAERYVEETKEESYQALVKSTKELCAFAKLKGDMNVVLEVFDYYVSTKWELNSPNVSSLNDVTIYTSEILNKLYFSSGSTIIDKNPEVTARLAATLEEHLKKIKN